MGAAYDSREFQATSRDDAIRLWGDAVEQSQYDDGHSYSGCIGMLDGAVRWLSGRATSRGEADRRIIDQHEKWTPPLGVEVEAADGVSYVIGGWCSS